MIKFSGITCVGMRVREISGWAVCVCVCVCDRSVVEFLRTLGICWQVTWSRNLLPIPGWHTPTLPPLTIQRRFTLRGKPDRESEMGYFIL